MRLHARSYLRPVAFARIVAFATILQRIVSAQGAAAPTKGARSTTKVASIEQTSQGTRPPALLVAHFDGLGVGFEGPQGTFTGRNPSDNSLAVGPNHIVQIVNTRMAIFTKKGAQFDSTGRVLTGPLQTNSLFTGFGGPCELRNNGDAVVRYDQLADRWLYVMPIFSRPPGEPQDPYSMCYAVSTGADPAGPYYRYEFKRPLFPDYPRPAIWPDGYYIPTSTSDDFIQKHLCIAERAKMLKGLPAAEQCMVIDGVNFLNNADIDGFALPPVGAPNIMMAAGGAQLHGVLADNVIYVWKVHVDWETPTNTGLSGPTKIAVAPYHYLCDGQLTSCVPQPDTSRRLDAQGDKIMQRLVYRNVNGHESIVALHSVNSAAGGGGVRWYEFRLDENRDPKLFQQGTYAPDKFYRWMGSIGMDRQGNIGMGYSFGGTPKYAGQRFAARLASDPPGTLGLRETVLVEGEAAQKNTIRWEDYTTTAMDPSDDCTFWYVGDYMRAGAASYSTRIGAFRLPGCVRGTVNGSAFFDLNHDGIRTPDEPGIAGWEVSYSGSQSGTLHTDADGNFSTWLNADPAFGGTSYTLSSKAPANPAWARTIKRGGEAPDRGAVAASGPSFNVRLKDADYLTGANFGYVCTVQNIGGSPLRFWGSPAGKTTLVAHDTGAFSWRRIVDSTLFLVNLDGTRFKVPASGAEAFDLFQSWLTGANTAHVENASYRLSTQLATATLNAAFGKQDANVTVRDAVAGSWANIYALGTRARGLVSAHPVTTEPGNFRSDAESYAALLEKLNTNTATITPSSPSRCPKPF